MPQGLSKRVDSNCPAFPEKMQKQGFLGGARHVVTICCWCQKPDSREPAQDPGGSQALARGALCSTQALQSSAHPVLPNTQNCLCNFRRCYEGRAADKGS